MRQQPQRLAKKENERRKKRESKSQRERRRLGEGHRERQERKGEGERERKRERKKRLGFSQQKAHRVPGSGVRTESEGVVTADSHRVLLALSHLTIRGKCILTHSHRVLEADTEQVGGEAPEGASHATLCSAWHHLCSPRQPSSSEGLSLQTPG